NGERHFQGKRSTERARGSGEGVQGGAEGRFQRRVESTQGSNEGNQGDAEGRFQGNVQSTQGRGEGLQGSAKRYFQGIRHARLRRAAVDGRRAWRSGGSRRPQ